MTLTYKHDLDILPVDLHAKIQVRMLVHSARRVRRTHTDTQTNRATDLWNSLPHDVVNASSVDQFKNRLDSYWEDKDWLYDFEAD